MHVSRGVSTRQRAVCCSDSEYNVIRIGIIGYGFMGQTHARAYAQSGLADITAIADPRPEAVGDGAAGNLESGAGDVDISGVRVTSEPLELLQSDEVDAVSICTPTPTHVPLTLQAIELGKHVLVEKPLALSADACQPVVDAVAECDLCIMPAMCMRFWPAWAWLKQTIDSQTYGHTLSATFTRLGSRPGWGQGFYADPAKCGGAILDLHIHDVDFIRWCFGDPASVSAVGVVGPAGGINHVMANFGYSNEVMVSAQGGWMRAGDFPFTMRYVVEFEHATVRFDLADNPALSVFDVDGVSHPKLADEDGYLGEVRSFLSCIADGRPPAVTINDAVKAIRLIEAEQQSINAARSVGLV